MHPILLKFGPVTIYSFGLFIALGLLVASFVAWKEARLRGLSEEKIIDIFLLTAFFSLLGSRAAFVLSRWSYFSLDPGKIFFLWKYPGLTLEGAFLGGLAFTVLSSFGLGLSIWTVLDVFSLSLASFSIAGFFGCFLDRCLPGSVWLPTAPLTAATIIFVILFYLARRVRFSKTPGLLFLSYLIFQSFSLLILSTAYGLVTILAIIVFAVRYPEYLKLWSNSLVMFLTKLKGTWKRGGLTSKPG